MKKRKIVKKPVFHKVFIQNIIVYAIVALAFGIVGTTIAAHFYGWYMDSDMFNMADSFCEAAFEAYEEYPNDEEQFQRAVTFDANTHSLGTMAVALVDKNTKEIVAQPSDSTIYLWGNLGDGENNEEDTPVEIYSCESEEIIKAIQQAYEDTGYVEGATYIKMDDFYQQGYTFVPGEVKIMAYGEGGGTVLKEMNFAPEDVTGYEHIVIKEEEHKYGDPIIFDNGISAESMKYLHEVIASGSWYDESSDYSGGGADIGKIGTNKCYSYMTLHLGQESTREYCVVGACSYSFFELWKSDLLLAYGILAFATLVIAFIVSYISYTKQKSFYEMDQYRRDITNTMAHDLKSPLMVISGFAENLLEQDLPEKSKHFTSSILENVQYMNQIIEKVLDLSKVENVDYKLHKEKLDLRELSEELVSNYTAQLEKRGLEVQMSGDCIVDADKLSMTQVLDNLISNAIKYTIEGSVIEITLNDNSYEISNASAVDFDMDIKDLVNPFVKGDNSRSGKQGSGIGLTIAKNLVEQHGYQLQLECDDGIFVARVKM